MLTTLLTRLKILLVVTFVIWQIAYMVLGNLFALYGETIEKSGFVQPAIRSLDHCLASYGNLTGVPRGWAMFASPLSREASFLTAWLEIEDGSSVVYRFETEPDDPRAYFRIGGWRMRKLNDCLVYTTAEQLPHEDDLPLYEAYVRHCIRRWNNAEIERARDLEARPARRVEHVGLIRRRLSFTGPKDPPGMIRPPRTERLGTFTPNGELIR